MLLVLGVERSFKRSMHALPAFRVERVRKDLELDNVIVSLGYRRGHDCFCRGPAG